MTSSDPAPISPPWRPAEMSSSMQLDLSVGRRILDGMGSVGYCVFDTALGSCGIVWHTRAIDGANEAKANEGSGSITGLALPVPAGAGIRSYLARRFAPAGEQPPPFEVQRAIDGIRAHLAGELDDLRWIDIDLSGVTGFDRSVYELIRGIGPGATLTYGEVAAMVGQPGAAQAVGQAMGRNPVPIIVPCHRVLAAGNKMGGFSAPGGTVTKRKILEIEQAPGFDDPVLF